MLSVDMVVCFTLIRRSWSVLLSFSELMDKALFEEDLVSTSGPPLSASTMLGDEERREGDPNAGSPPLEISGVFELSASASHWGGREELGCEESG